MSSGEVLEIRPQRRFGQFLRPFVAALVLFLALTTAIAMIVIFNSAAASFYTIGGVTIGAALTAVLVALLHRKHRRMVTATVVRVTPSGLDMSDQAGLQLQIAWPDITHIDDVLTRVTNPNSVPVAPLVSAVRPGTIRAPGVIGWGHRSVPARLPRWVRQQLEQAPTNPQTGMVQIALPLGFLDPQWTRGPARDWFGRYRPDLLARLGTPSQPAR